MTAPSMFPGAGGTSPAASRQASESRTDLRGIPGGPVAHLDFVKLLMEHRSTMHSFVYAIVRDPHLTEDILQEVSIVLWSKFSEYEPGTSFGARSRSVAYREILAARRSESRARRHFDEACAQQILRAYERRSAKVDTTEHRETLRRCIEFMGGDLRKIMLCRYGQKMSSRDLAEKFSRTAQAVDAMIYRGKKLLLECVRSHLRTQEEGA